MTQAKSTFIPKTLVGGANLNSVQLFWDQPGVSPIVGANTAQAAFPPIPASIGVVGWWVWFAVAPSAGDSALLRLYRYRFNGGYSVTQISDPFTINNVSAYQIYDLSSLLRASAADFSEAINEDHLAVSVVMTGNFTLRALNQRVLFGLPDTGQVLQSTPPMGAPTWPA